MLKKNKKYLRNLFPQPYLYPLQNNIPQSFMSDHYLKGLSERLYLLAVEIFNRKLERANQIEYRLQ